MYVVQVQPDLEVKVKPSMHQRKIAEAKAQRMMARDELWARRRMHDVSEIRIVVTLISSVDGKYIQQIVHNINKRREVQ